MSAANREYVEPAPKRHSVALPAPASAKQQQLYLDFDGLAEASCCHPINDWAFFSLLQRPQDTFETDFGEVLVSGKRRRMVQNSYPLHLMASVLSAVDTRLDTYLSQAEFIQPNRRAVNLWRVGLVFVDLDTYNTQWAGNAPEQIADAVLYYCDAVFNLPRPSLIVSSGRGIYLKWFHESMPRQALPRWAALECELVKVFSEFGADPSARDVSRVLRIVGTTNTKSGKTVRVLHVEADEQGQPVRYGFDYLAEYVLPKSREDIESDRKARVARKAAHQARKAEWEANAGKVVGYSNLRVLGPQQLNWDRLNDLQALAELRMAANGGQMPDGEREQMMFWQMNFMLLSKVITPDQIWHESQALAANIGMTGYDASKLGTLYAKAKAHAAGERVEWNGRQLSPLYTPKNATLIDSFRITSDEERQLKTIISKGEAQNRARERDRVRKLAQRLQEGRKPRATDEQRARAVYLVNELGWSYRQVAAEMQVPIGSVHRWVVS